AAEASSVAQPVTCPADDRRARVAHQDAVGDLLHRHSIRPARRRTDDDPVRVLEPELESHPHQVQLKWMTVAEADAGANARARSASTSGRMPRSPRARA